MKNVVVLLLTISFGQLSLFQSALGNEFITEVKKKHSPEMITSIYTSLKKDHPSFFHVGQENGKIYRIAYPTEVSLYVGRPQVVKPFLLSHRSEIKMTHNEAYFYCLNHDGFLATAAQLSALDSALNIEPRPPYEHEFDDEAIPSLLGETFWGADTGVSNAANYFEVWKANIPSAKWMSQNSFYTFIGDLKEYVRCVRPTE